MESKKYRKVKGYYDDDLWSISRVRDAVVKNWITPAEYEEITKEKYQE